MAAITAGNGPVRFDVDYPRSCAQIAMPGWYSGSCLGSVTYAKTSSTGASTSMASPAVLSGAVRGRPEYGGKRQ